MNLELRKERKEKRKYSKERTFYFIFLLLLFFFSYRSRPPGDQSSTFSRPEHFLIATGDRATAQF